MRQAGLFGLSEAAIGARRPAGGTGPSHRLRGIPSGRDGRVRLNSDWPPIGGSSAGVVSYAGAGRHGRRA
jgi:hypothetical protein